MGVTLRRDPAAALPPALLDFVERAIAPVSRHVYTDGSFAITAPILESLSLSSTALTASYSLATTGVYLSSLGDSPPLALLIQTPKHLATDAYYQELLGISISVLQIDGTIELGNIKDPPNKHFMRKSEISESSGKVEGRHIHTKNIYQNGWNISNISN